MIRQTLIFALAAAATLTTQQPGESTSAEATFYRAYWLENGQHQPTQAVEAYRTFLVQAPNHAYAGRALERTRAILTRLGRAGEVDTILEEMQRTRRRVPARPGGAAGLNPNTATTSELNSQEQDLVAEITTLQSHPTVAKLERLKVTLEEIRTELKRRATPNTEKSDGTFEPYFNEFDITTMTRQDRATFMSRVRSFVRSSAKDMRSRGEHERSRRVVQMADRAASLVNVDKHAEAQRILEDLKRELGGR